MKILLLDSMQVQARAVEAILTQAAHEVCIVHTAEAAIQSVDTTFDVVLIELQLHDHSGTEFLYEFRTYLEFDAIPVVIVSSINVADVLAVSCDWGMLQPCYFSYLPDFNTNKFYALLQDVSANVNSG